MKKVILLFLLIFCKQFSFSQSSLGIGTGIGNQFGLPGVRANIRINKIEGSLNFGIPFSKYITGDSYIPFGAGISCKIHGDKLFEAFITYHFGLVMFLEGGFNNNPTYFNTHSLTYNVEFKLYQYLRLRIGAGLINIPWTGSKFLPTFSGGFMIQLWEKEQ